MLITPENKKLNHNGIKQEEQQDGLHEQTDKTNS